MPPSPPRVIQKGVDKTLTIINTYGSAIRRLALANVITEALTKKDNPHAQRDVKTRVSTNTTNFSTVLWKPVKKNIRVSWGITKKILCNSVGWGGGGGRFEKSTSRLLLLADGRMSIQRDQCFPLFYVETCVPITRRQRFPFISLFKVTNDRYYDPTGRSVIKEIVCTRENSNRKAENTLLYY